MNTATKSPTEQLRQLAYVVDEFRKLDPEMPMQQAAAFLVVTQRDGLTVVEVANRTGQNTASITRTLQAIGTLARASKPGLELVTLRPDPLDARCKTVHMTPKGQTLAARLKDHLR